MKSDSRRRAAHVKVAVLVLCVFAVALGALRLWRMSGDPATALLIGRGGAEWICFDSPPYLPARTPEDLVTFFRKTVHVDSAPASARLIVNSFRLANVQIDGVQALGPWQQTMQWRQPREADIAHLLSPGDHTVLVEVFNQNAPPALLVQCDSIELCTNITWEASIDGQHWTPARLAKSPRWANITTQFPSSERALLSALQVLAPVFLVSLGIALFLLPQTQRIRPAPAVIRFITPESLRWALLGVWIILAVNNIWKLPAEVGYDVEAHLAYILFIHHYGKLPLATDGWQMFEAPLYYLISLPIVKLAISSMDLDGITKLLRIIPLVCALGQVEICFRTLKLVFPGRRDLQVIGILAGALSPMLLYRSQTIGTEPMAGALAAATIWMALAYAYGSPRWRTWIGAAAIGALLGLALLTKVSAILIAPMLIAWMMATHWINGDRVIVIGRRIAIVFGMATLVCGWYYARNWIELGKPFVGGWDPLRRIDWWQEPGFRTPEEFLRFGRAMTHPVWASMAGFWDGLYSTLWTDGSLSSMVLYDHRPPWNFNFVLSASLLAIVPNVLLLIGAISAFVKSMNADQARVHQADSNKAQAPKPAWFANSGALVFSVLVIAIYLAAIFDLHLTAPIHSTSKATYTLGLVPCYAALIATGFAMTPKRRLVRAVLISLLAVWCVNSLAAYFIW